MSHKRYKVGELLALRSHAEVAYERNFIDSLARQGHCSEILRVRHLVPLANGVHLLAGDLRVAEAQEPVRQQLDGQELDLKLQNEPPGDSQIGATLSAPPDVGAHLSDSFGQFIKAVASPSNVRVTAGGRIVLNTRGTSPTGKSSRDKGNNGESFNASRPGSQVGAGNGFVGHFVPSQGIYPAFNPYAGPMQPMPAMQPMPPMGYYPGLSFPMAPMPVGPGMMTPQAAQQAAQAAARVARTEDNRPNSSSQQMNQATPNGEMMPPYALAAPMHSPYFPHGPMVPIPMQMSMPMMHAHMAIPAQGGAAVGFDAGPGRAQSHGHMGTSSSQQPVNVATEAAPRAATQHVPENITQATVRDTPAADNEDQPNTAPLSSIKLSDVIQKHLEGFRDHRKWCQSQIEYNRHQIDEREMVGRVRDLGNQIKYNEIKLHQQIALEKEMLRTGQPGIAPPATEPFVAQHSRTTPHPIITQRPPQATDTGYPTNSTQQTADRGHLSNQARVIRPRSFREESRDHGSIDEGDTVRRASYKKDRTRSKNWNSQQRSKFTLSTDIEEKSDASSSFMTLPAKSHSLIPEPAKKHSTLPKHAALAPPFHPRGKYRSADTSSDSAVKMQNGTSSIDHRASFTAREPAPRFNDSFQYTSLKDVSNDRPVDRPVNRPAPLANGDLGKPYLEGYLRAGIEPSKATDEDYHYLRKLTIEELQARRLYWVKAPDSVITGLPKYDGKHFYPPSPVKVKEAAPYFDESFKPALPVGGYCDYGFKPAVPSKTQLTSDSKQAEYKALLEQQYAKAKGAEKEKRFTKSDNINSGLAMAKKTNKDRPTTSLASQEASESDQPLQDRVGNPGDYPQARSSGSESSHELLFQGRREMQRSRARQGLLKSLGQKSSAASANALPGAMSSTTAHGVLPQYAGSAAASLNPAKASDLPSAGSHASPNKTQNLGQGGMNGRRGENKPPVASKGADLHY